MHKNIIMEDSLGKKLYPITRAENVIGLGDAKGVVSVNNKSGKVLLTSEDIQTSKTNEKKISETIKDIETEVDNIKQSGAEINNELKDILSSMGSPLSDNIKNNLSTLKEIPVTKNKYGIMKKEGEHIRLHGYYNNCDIRCHIENLVPDNIKKGVSLGGVTGTYSGFSDYRLQVNSMNISNDMNVVNSPMFPRDSTILGFVILDYGTDVFIYEVNSQDSVYNDKEDPYFQKVQFSNNVVTVYFVPSKRRPPGSKITFAIYHSQKG